MKIATMGMGLVKAVFAIHGVKAHGKAAVKKTMQTSSKAHVFLQP
jgi:predicted ABC-class ATPase